MIKQNEFELVNTDFRLQPNKVDNLFPIVFATLQLPLSLESIDQIHWGLLQKVALQMMYTINKKKMTIEFYWLQTDFAWSHQIYIISIPNPLQHMTALQLLLLCQIGSIDDESLYWNFIDQVTNSRGGGGEVKMGFAEKFHMFYSFAAFFWNLK